MTPPGVMRVLLAMIQKDLLLLWRTRAHLSSVLVFGASALLLFSFAVGPEASTLQRLAPGFLWLGLLMSSTLLLSESFGVETEDAALEGLILLPAPPAVMFYGKALANWLALALLGVFLIPVMIVLYNVAAERTPALVWAILLGTAGLSAPGTLYAAMATQARAQQLLLPLLLFPLVVPVLLSAVKLSALIVGGDPMQQTRSWVIFLLAFDAIYWSLCGVLFSQVVED